MVVKVVSPQHFVRLLLLALLLSSCGGGDHSGVHEHYTHYQTLGNDGWQQDEELFFVVPIEDTSPSYQVLIHLRFSPEYQLRELPVGFAIEYPTKEIYQGHLLIPTDRSDMERAGYNIFSTQYMMKRPLHFDTAGTYAFSLVHLLRDSVANGIIEVGLTLSKQ